MKTDLVIAGYLINDNKVLLIKHKKLGLWLPVGGHIEKDETPDDAVLREFEEEVGLSVRIFGHTNVPMEGNMKRVLAVPFHVNVHSVGDHDHCCFFYICELARQQDILPAARELDDFAWFSKEDLFQERVPKDVRTIALKALEMRSELKN